MPYLNVSAARTLIYQFARERYGGDLRAVKADVAGLSSYLNGKIAAGNRVEGSETPVGTTPRVGRALLMQSVPDAGGFVEYHPARAAFVVDGAASISRTDAQHGDSPRRCAICKQY